MKIKDRLKQCVAAVVGVEVSEVTLEHPEAEIHGDYATNLALVKKVGRDTALRWAEVISSNDMIDKVEVAGAGFVNIFIKNKVFIKELNEVITQAQEYGKTDINLDKRVMVEFAHPNTHKELHIGHMRTLIVGESLARLFAFSGAKVFRANYQGDVGPHVAKALWGITKIMEEKKLDWDQIEDWDRSRKAHFLGEGYVKGSVAYEENKAEIDRLNQMLYERAPEWQERYRRTREWSLDYYDGFYQRFGTRFDKLFFESEVADEGKRRVEEAVGRVFERSEGAIVFPGEKYGLHTRVFVTAAGTPTYEGKEMGLAYAQEEVFDFTKCVHVVGNEQAGYFKVVIKALELLEPRFAGREEHLAMGMVQLVGRKMSSRTGEILRVDDLIGEVRTMVKELVEEGRGEEEREEIIEKVALGAIKWSMLRVEPKQGVAFDVKVSVSLEGNSGPYVQYTYARTRSVLEKTEVGGEVEAESEVNAEERAVLVWLARWGEVVNEAAEKMSPNTVAAYLFELAQRFNSFYSKHSILSAESSQVRQLRVRLTAGVGEVLRTGLNLLGIDVVEKM